MAALFCPCRYMMGEAEVREAVASALRLVNMQDYMYRATHTLSGGQRQRVAIAGVVGGGSVCCRCRRGGQRQRITIAGACCRLHGAPHDALSLLSRGWSSPSGFGRVL